MAYQTNQDRLRRQRLLAQSLMSSGTAPIQQYSAGGAPVPVSPWQGINKLAQTALGAYADNRADKQESELEEQRKASMQDWISQMPSDRSEMMAWALRGEDFGETGQAVGNSVLSQALSPQKRNVKVVNGRLYDLDTNEWIESDGLGSPASINKVTPSDYTPQSLAEYAQSGDYNVLERYEPSRTITGPDGLQYTFDPVLERYVLMSVEQQPGYEPTAERPEPKPMTVEDVAGTKAQIAEAEEGAKVTGRETAEQQINWGKTVDKYNQITSQWDLVDSKIDEALAETSKWTTGPLGTLGAYIPGSSARDYYETLQTIKANLGFDKLQQMRDASPTGGALGQVSEMENKLLQAVNSSLEQGQSAGQMQQNLQTIKQQLADLRATKREAFMRDQARFSTPNSPLQPESEEPPGLPTPGDVVDGWRFKGGSPGDPNSWERVQ